MTSPAHIQIKATAKRFAHRLLRPGKHLLARALILALFLQLFPFPLKTLDIASETDHALPAALGLADLSRLVYPQIVYADVIALNKTSDGPAEPGETFHYTLVVVNDGIEIDDPQVVDIIDMRHLEEASIIATGGWKGGIVGTDPITVTFSRANRKMAASATAVLTISLIPHKPITDGTVITNNLYYATWGDGGRFNGTEVITTVVNAPAFLLSSVNGAEPVCAGSLTSYTIYLANSGHLATSGNYTFTLDLDEKVAFAGASPSPFGDPILHSDGLITWGNINESLDPGEAISRTFWVTVASAAEHDTVLTHIARASSPQDVMPDGLLSITSTVERVAADFASNAPVCSGDVVTFTRLYNDVAVTNAYWDWGDGTPGAISIADTVTHTYGSGGYYTVTHIVTGTCMVSQTHTYSDVIFVDGISAAFEPATTVSICVGGGVLFTVTSVASSPIQEHRWDFGDGVVITTPGTITTTWHEYGSAGLYTVTLTITNVNGCTDRISRTSIILVDGITPSFEPSQTITVCANSAVVFTDTSTANSAIVTREWDFGDGSPIMVTSAPTVPHMYANGGYYTVTLRVTNTTGCAATTATSNAVFVDSASADFIAIPTSACINSAITFTSTSTASSTISGYAWRFGDGSPIVTTTEPAITHIYTAPGYYTVVLTITTSSGGCPATQTKTDYIFISGLTPSFEPVLPFTICLGSAVTFTDTSVSSSTIVAHHWDWGDGTISTTDSITTASHTYLSSGYYTVTLTVTNETGCAATYALADAVLVNQVEAGILPLPTYICLNAGPATVFFSSTSVASGTITEHLWDFGDGTTIHSGAVPTVPHAYTSAGYFTVTLVVTSGQCSDQIVSPNHITATQAIPSFEPTQTVTTCAGSYVSFTDTSQITGTVYLRQWDFGDGTVSPNVSHTTTISHAYASAGQYTVSLSIGMVGCEPTPVTTQAVGIVSVEQAQAAFISGPASCAGSAVPFTYTGQVIGSLATCEWDFGDGTTGSGVTPSHSYANPGEYIVTLTATTSSGCYDVVTGTVFIEGANVSFDPPAPQLVCINEPVTFRNTSAVSGTIASLLWDFGDGTTSTAPVANHAYAATGSYTVTLTVETSAGCIISVSRSNWITVESIAAEILPTTPISVCVGEPLVLTDNSTIVGAFGSRLWDFGDGTTSTDQVASHTFASWGTFTVTLNVTSAGGCTDVATKVIKVHGAVIDFDMSKPGCFQPGGVDVAFTNATTFSGSRPDVFWDLGNGLTSSDWSTTTKYSAPGTYEVTLWVTTATGCAYSQSKLLSIGTVTASMKHTTPATICAGDSMLFENTSIVVGGGVASPVWDFGDGTTSTLDVVSHQYTSGGTYVVTLTVSLDSGCSDWVTTTVTVEDVTAGFVSLTPLPTCVNNSVTFSSTSSATNGIANLKWDFGDGSSGSGALVSHVYSDPGIYTVWLEATNQTGCQHAISMTIEIEGALADITPPSGTVCQYSPVTFTDNSAVVGMIGEWYWQFGDGSTSTAQNPSHAFANAGMHTVTLLVTTMGGCTSTVSTVVDVQPQPTPNIQIDPSPTTVDKITTFTDTMGMAGSTWEWDFGDGSTSGPLSTPYTTHVYRVLTNTLMTVVLTVTSPSGCVGVTQQTLEVSVVMPDIIVVEANPNVLFAGETAAVCVIVTDTLGKPITDGTTINLSVSPPLGILADTVLSTTGGSACTTFTANVPSSGTVTIEASAEPATGSGAIVIHPEFYINLVLDRAAIELDESINLTVTVLDRYTNPVPDGTAITLTQIPEWGLFSGDTPSIILYTSGGVATTGYTGLNAGLVTLSAAIGAYTDQERLSISLKHVYIPLVVRNYGPDLRVLDIKIGYGASEQEPDYVLVTIQNSGFAPVSLFWVDLYFQPSEPPQTGQIWPDLCIYGKAWYVVEPLQAGETLVLDTRSPDDPNSPGTRYSIWPDKLPTKTHTLYAMVDSYWIPYGLIAELNENNNILGPIIYSKSVAVSAAPASTTTRQPSSSKPLLRAIASGPKPTPTP